MKLRLAAPLAAGAFLIGPAPAPAALDARLSVKPQSPVAGERAVVELRPYWQFERSDGSCCRFEPADPVRNPFRVQAISPTGRIFWVRVRRDRPSVWLGSFRFGRAGRWELRIANYYFSGRCERPGCSYRGRRLRVRVRSLQPSQPPTGFGSLGRRGCNPPSPARPDRAEAFGTSTGGQLWALFFLSHGARWASRDSAIFERMAGTEQKIVFRWSRSSFFPVVAIAPNGSRHRPLWGPTPHGSSTWNRPGYEWEAGFRFTSAGCWRIRVAKGRPTGDVWLLIRS